ncbi:MAG TPA: cytochrome c-type biogenesis CcmF C-terminal domain-containing protein, partial [Gemmatimonadota bacterium]|nr:cytochrome c-type biogenesis CcmF C-terminal domain-containing protein [Gemmatimonadota bacterium]
ARTITPTCTMYPILAEAARGVKVSVGAPYFNQMSVPIALALIFLTGVGPALPWRRGSPDLLKQKFLWPSVAALVLGVVFFVIGVRNFMTLATLVLAVFAVGLIVGEVWRPVQARRAAHGESVGTALASVVNKGRRRYGGYIVHVGVIVLAVGVALSSTYRAETEATMQPGQLVNFEGYNLRLDSLYAGREAHRDFVEAAFSVGKGQQLSTVMRPRLNYYPMSTQPIGTPSVRTRPTEDFYLSLMAYAQSGASATVSIIVNPMVVWIWIGGGICVIGALFAISSLGFGADRSAGRRSSAGSRAEPVEASVGGAD